MLQQPALPPFTSLPPLPHLVACSPVGVDARKKRHEARETSALSRTVRSLSILTVAMPLGHTLS